MDDMTMTLIRRRMKADHEWARNTWLASEAATSPSLRLRLARMLHGAASLLERRVEERPLLR